MVINKRRSGKNEAHEYLAQPVGTRLYQIAYILYLF